MGKFRRHIRQRSTSKNEKAISTKVIVITSVILILLILACGIVLYLRNEQISLAKQKEEQELQRRLAEIFVAQEEQEKVEEENKPKKDIIVNLTVLGNVLCEEALYQDAYTGEEGQYNFAPMFEAVKQYTQKSDIVLGSLETNFVAQPYSGKHTYNSPKQLAQALKEVGVDILNLANNHSYDYGKEGVKSTIEYLNELEIEHVGTNNEDNSQMVVRQVRGVTIAFLSYTYGLNGITQPTEEQKEYVNIMNKEKIAQDIGKIRSTVDFICVNMHWGDIASDKINDQQRQMTDFLVECGADIILGSHPASLQPMEIRQNKEGENVYIAYSTGNFISASEYKNSNIEMILEIQFIKDAEDGKTRLSKVTYKPMYLMDYGAKAENRYRLLDIKQEMEKYENNQDGKVEKEVYDKLQQAWIDIEKLIGKE